MDSEIFPLSSKIGLIDNSAEARNDSYRDCQICIPFIYDLNFNPQTWNTESKIIPVLGYTIFH